MPYTKKQFLEDVTKEAVALKEHATKEELGRLDFDGLWPTSPIGCIYGQVTGNCKSLRASFLITKCCKRFFKINDEHYLKTDSMKDINQQVNGEEIKGVETAEDFRKTRLNTWIHYFSSIETYIMTPFAKSKNLIDFLKGKTNDLKL